MPLYKYYQYSMLYLDNKKLNLICLNENSSCLLMRMDDILLEMTAKYSKIFLFYDYSYTLKLFHVECHNNNPYF